MTASTWPTHEDGTNKRVGEMTPEEKRAVFKAAVERVQAGFERPDVQERFARALTDKSA